MYIIMPLRSSQPPQSVLKPCIAKLPMPTAVHATPYMSVNQLLLDREGRPFLESYCILQST